MVFTAKVRLDGLAADTSRASALRSSPCMSHDTDGFRRGLFPSNASEGTPCADARWTSNPGVADRNPDAAEGIMALKGAYLLG